MHAVDGGGGICDIVAGCVGGVVEGEWRTGVQAYPWSIAGNASLARNPEIRIWAGGEEGMTREVGDRVYGLSWYEVGGREEYGLVSAEASRRLAVLERGGDDKGWVVAGCR